MICCSLQTPCLMRIDDGSWLAGRTSASCYLLRTTTQSMYKRGLDSVLDFCACDIANFFHISPYLLGQVVYHQPDVLKYFNDRMGNNLVRLSRNLESLTSLLFINNIWRTWWFESKCLLKTCQPTWLSWVLSSPRTLQGTEYQTLCSLFYAWKYH